MSWSASIRTSLSAGSSFSEEWLEDQMAWRREHPQPDNVWVGWKEWPRSHDEAWRMHSNSIRMQDGSLLDKAAPYSQAVSSVAEFVQTVCLSYAPAQLHALGVTIVSDARLQMDFHKSWHVDLAEEWLDGDGSEEFWSLDVVGF